MQIILSSQDIKNALVASLSGSIKTEGMDTVVTFTSGRSKNDLTATVSINPKAAGATPPVPDFSDDGEGELKLVEPAAASPFAESQAKADSAGDNASTIEGGAAAAAAQTTGTLFKRPGA